MLATTLMDKLIAIKNVDKPVFAAADFSSNRRLYVDLFANANGLPAILVSEDTPLPSVKHGSTLLHELHTWKNDSIHYDPSSIIYLMLVHDYEDSSYDFRYYKINKITNEDLALVLIYDSHECFELREFYEAP